MGSAWLISGQNSHLSLLGPLSHLAQDPKSPTPTQIKLSGEERRGVPRPGPRRPPPQRSPVSEAETALVSMLSVTTLRTHRLKTRPGTRRQKWRTLDISAWQDRAVVTGVPEGPGPGAPRGQGRGPHTGGPGPGPVAEAPHRRPWWEGPKGSSANGAGAGGGPGPCSSRGASGGQRSHHGQSHQAEDQHAGPEQRFL